MIGRAIALLDYLYPDDSDMWDEDDFAEEDYELELWFWMKGMM